MTCSSRKSLQVVFLWSCCLSSCNDIAVAAAKKLIKGVSYSPVPLKSREGASALPQDDWMSADAVDMWGPAGRGDLRTIRKLGANTIRLYGNNPENDHTSFLDEAHVEGLAVLPGMSDWPYYQMPASNCMAFSDYNCFGQIKPLYSQNLQRGFLLPNHSYHPALKIMNIINEPDLKVPPTATTGGSEGPLLMCRAIISAFDAMLQAEKEANVTGPLVNFTATFSYAICLSCAEYSNKPALGQMWHLDDAMHHPEKYGYVPKNNITAAYHMRWTHSFNTQNPATDLQHQFLDEYSASFPTTPVYIGEYHRVRANQTADVGMILEMAQHSPLFMGISFFQYQVAYYKTGSEMDFGMFGLGNYVIGRMLYFGKSYDIFCLDPVSSPESGMAMPNAIAQVYGGEGIDNSTLCVANPLGVPLSEQGLSTIVAERNPSQLALFAERIVHRIGATVVDHDELRTFVERYAQNSGTGSTGTNGFSALVGELATPHAWIVYDDNAKCVADRTAVPSTVAAAIGWACTQRGSICENISSACEENPYKVGDYVFSRFYEQLGSSADPLQACSFDGAAMFASSRVYENFTGSWQCIVGASVPAGEPTTTSAFEVPTTTLLLQTTPDNDAVLSRSVRVACVTFLSLTGLIGLVIA